MATTYQTPVTSPAITSQAEELIQRARELGPIIREHASDTEGNRRLAKPVLDALVKAGFTRLFTPQGAWRPGSGPGHMRAHRRGGSAASTVPPGGHCSRLT